MCQLDVYLPEDVYCASGRTIELYNRQICLQAEQYHVKWDCRVGKALKRKFSVTGTDALLGDYSLTFEIYDDRLVCLCRKEAVLHIVKNTIVRKYSILPVGDSLTNNKLWEPEVMGLSHGKISFVGTRGPYFAADSQAANGAAAMKDVPEPPPGGIPMTVYTLSKPGMWGILKLTVKGIHFLIR